MLRPVTVFKHVKPDPMVNKWDKVKDREGRFHQWGSSYEEFEDGPGNFSVAIVELEDGEIVTPSADMIKFEDK